jgi:hypothetical protein
MSSMIQIKERNHLRIRFIEVYIIYFHLTYTDESNNYQTWKFSFNLTLRNVVNFFKKGPDFLSHILIRQSRFNNHMKYSALRNQCFFVKFITCLSGSVRLWHAIIYFKNVPQKKECSIKVFASSRRVYINNYICWLHTDLELSNIKD